MLYPAQLYKEELQKKLTACWYDPKYQYFFSGSYELFNIPNDALWRRDFVHLDKDGNVDGYFAYHYEDGGKNMCQFGLISFAKNGTLLTLDVIEHIKNMFKQGAQRCEFWAFADNPVIPLYEKLVERYGGKKVGTLTRTAYFNGKYHDAYIYEILVENLPKCTR